MPTSTTSIAGFEIPSTEPIFLTVVGVHVLIGVAAVVCGAVAMLSPKAHGRHPTAGTLYFWCIAALAASASMLAIVRWSEDYDLFVLGTLAFAAAFIGRRSRRALWPRWARYHIVGMGLSYVLMLTAFYVDNGKSLPLWNRLPTVAYWFLPAVIGAPLILRALLRYAGARGRFGR